MLRKMIADIEAAGGEGTLYDRIANGETVLAISRDFGVSRNFLSSHLNRDAEHKQSMRNARETRADFIGDEITEIADSATPLDANVAKLRIDTRRFIAGRLSPEVWSDKQAPLIQINANSMHLNALRKIRAEDTAAAALPAAEDMQPLLGASG